MDAEYHFQATKEAKTEQVAAFFIDLVTEYDKRGKHRLDIFLDRNRAHKTKMQTMVAEQTASLPIEVRFHLMPAYSPKVNVVEYAIHLIRLSVLHHADHKNSLADFEQKIRLLCQSGAILSKTQIINLLGYIEELILKFVALSPKRE
jgi:hypothetical protein